MVNRPRFNPDARSCLNQLLSALRSDAGEQLIALRTRKLLVHAPAGPSEVRRDWLRRVLPEQWHYDRAVKALSLVAGGQKAAEGNRTKQR